MTMPGKWQYALEFISFFWKISIKINHSIYVHESPSIRCQILSCYMTNRLQEQIISNINPLLTFLLNSNFGQRKGEMKTVPEGEYCCFFPGALEFRLWGERSGCERTQLITEQGTAKHKYTPLWVHDYSYTWRLNYKPHSSSVILRTPKHAKTITPTKAP